MATVDTVKNIEEVPVKLQPLVEDIESPEGWNVVLKKNRYLSDKIVWNYNANCVDRVPHIDVICVDGFYTLISDEKIGDDDTSVGVRNISEAKEALHVGFEKIRQMIEQELLKPHLAHVPGIGDTHIRKLIEEFDFANNVLAATENELKRVSGIGPMTAMSIHTSLKTK